MTSLLTKIRLGDYCEFINGGSWSDKEYTNNNLDSIPVVKVTNMRNGTVDLNDLSYLPKSSLNKYKKNILREGDIVMATVGSHPNQPNSVVGRTISIPKTADGFLLNQNAVCIRILDESKLDPKYLKYLVKTEYFAYLSYSRARGSANQVRLAISELSNFYLEIREIETQKQIASILSNYDDLIENNNQRIQLLEEMAEEIYKEWFVRMRFPGYEDSKFYNKDGAEVPYSAKGTIPDGWKDGEIQDLVELKKGKIITKSTITKGNVPVVAGGLTPAYYHNKANTSSPTITISSSGANAGYVNIYYKDIWVSDCSYLDTAMTKWLYFFYCTFKVRQNEVFHLQRGAAQPHVYSKDIHKLNMICPPKEVLNDFEDLITPFFNEIDLLKQKNQVLQETRNLLLPRLISGKLPVENLEIEEMNIAAEPQEKYSM